MPGESFTFRFKATDPGVFMYHCGTKPVLAHIANGMYGAIVVEPVPALPKVDHEYVLVAGEWYLSSDGIDEPASLDMDKARAMMPDWTTFNGYADQYVTHPLTADPGDTVRFYVVDAGPSLTTRRSTSSARSSTRSDPNGDMTGARAERSPDGRSSRPAVVPCSRSRSTTRALPVRQPRVRRRRPRPGRLLKVGNPKGTAMSQLDDRRLDGS